MNLKRDIIACVISLILFTSATIFLGFDPLQMFIGGGITLVILIVADNFS